MVCSHLVFSFVVTLTYDIVQVIAGHCKASVYKELKYLIPTAAAFGGVLPLASSIAADLSGAMGNWYA